MKNRRSGHELTNFNTGFDLSADIKTAAIAAAKKKASSAADGQGGPGTAKTASTVATSAYDIFAPPPVAERYSGNNWNPQSSLAGDAGFQRLRQALDDSAATSDAVRLERENDLRKRSAAAGAIMALYVPVGTIAGAVLYAFTEGAIALNKWLSEDLDSPEQRKRAQDAVARLWGEWMLLPPPFSPELESSKSYADRVEAMFPIFDATEKEGPPWQEEWLKTMALAMESPIPVIRDVSRLGWIPIDAYRWIGNGFYEKSDKTWHWEGLGLGATDLQFGQSRTVHYKPGWLSAERETTTTTTAPTFEELMAHTDPLAAGVGAIVAARYGVAIEPVVEAAVEANHKYGREIGPSPHHQGWRLKAVFLESVAAALVAPKNPMLVNQRQTVDARLVNLKTVKQEKVEIANALLLKPGSVSMYADFLKARKVKEAARPVLGLERRGFEAMLAWHDRPLGLKGLDR